MSEKTTSPKISILHFHPTGKPATWITTLATQLRADGVDVHLDVWDLQLGQDVYNYKEKAIYDTSFKHVLIILDVAYFDKVAQGNAQNQLETQLTRNELYKDVEQTMLIPVVRRRVGDTKEQLPPAIRGRYCLDFSENHQAAAYAQLTQTIYDTRTPPIKPPLGSPMKLSNAYFSAMPYLELIRQQPTRMNQQSHLFFQAFLAVLKQAKSDHQFLRIAWREFLEEVSIKDLEPSFNTTSLIEALEELGKIAQKGPLDSVLSIFIQELFLTTIIVGFQARNFRFLENLLQGHYLNVHLEQTSFVLFNCWKEQSLAALTEQQATGITRALHDELTPHYSLEQIVEADLICHYIAQMKAETWVPFLAFYIEDKTYPISWLDKLSIKKFFNKTKRLYNVDTATDFGKAVNNAYLHQIKHPLKLYSAVLPLDKVVPRKVAYL
ncbi:MAG: toll/interleukin-1 receptor domain-containing protein [Aureispira sp.]